LYRYAEVGESMELGEGLLEQRVAWGGLTPGSVVKKMAVFPRVAALDEQGMPVTEVGGLYKLRIKLTKRALETAWFQPSNL
jgi:hypothetical protein